MPSKKRGRPGKNKSRFIGDGDKGGEDGKGTYDFLYLRLGSFPSYFKFYDKKGIKYLEVKYPVDFTVELVNLLRIKYPENKMKVTSGSVYTTVIIYLNWSV